MPDAAWPPPPARPRLAEGVVDVWLARLAAGGAHERALLAPAELERAARFADPEHGRCWATARGILRALLGAALDADPRALAFAEGERGKPALAAAADARDPRAPAAAAAAERAARLRFNLSHSGDVALFALTLDREVGVDVELPRRAVDHVAIARRVLGAAEAERLRRLDPPARERAFLRAWVRWEAVLKCRGVGIGGADAPSAGPQPWLCDLDPGPPAAAAVAVERGPCEVRRWAWTPAEG